MREHRTSRSPTGRLRTGRAVVGDLQSKGYEVVAPQFPQTFAIFLFLSISRLVKRTHWVSGILNAARYGIVAGSLSTRGIRYGSSFGATVRASDYVILPAARLYEPIWEYDANILANDFSPTTCTGSPPPRVLRLLSR